MRAWIGATIVAAALAAGSTASARGAPSPQTSPPRTEIAHTAAVAAVTEFSSRRRHPRAQRHVHRHRPPYRRQYVYAPRGYDYYARPHWYRPHGVTPFFPFGPWGYGLGPSW